MVVFLLILFIISLFALGLFLSNSYLFLLFDYASYLLPNISVSKRSGKISIANFVPYVDLLYELNIIETKNKYQLALEIKDNFENVLENTLKLSNEFSIYLIKDRLNDRCILFLSQPKHEAKETWFLKMFPFSVEKWIKQEKETLIRDLVKLFRNANHLLENTKVLDSEAVIALISKECYLDVSTVMFSQLAHNHARIFGEIELHNGFFKTGSKWVSILRLTSISFDKNEIAQLSNKIKQYDDKLTLNFLIKKEQNRIRIDIYLKIDANSLKELKHKTTQLQEIFSNVPGCVASIERFTPVLTFCSSLPASEPTEPLINLGNNDALVLKIIKTFYPKRASSKKDHPQQSDSFFNLRIKHLPFSKLPINVMFTCAEQIHRMNLKKFPSIFINMEDLPQNLSVINLDLLKDRIPLDKQTQKDILKKTIKILQEFDTNTLLTYYEQHKSTFKLNGKILNGKHPSLKIALGLLSANELNGKFFNILLDSNPINLSYQILFLSNYIKTISQPTFIFLNRDKSNKEIRTLFANIVKQNANCKLVIVLNESTPKIDTIFNLDASFLLSFKDIISLTMKHVSLTNEIPDRIVCISNRMLYLFSQEQTSGMK